MNKEGYKNYLNSDYWKNLRRKILNKNKYCQICNSIWFIQVHHKRYVDRKGNILGREKLSDLIVLCRECHEFWHKFFQKRVKVGKSYDKIAKLIKLGSSKERAFEAVFFGKFDSESRWLK